MAVKLTKQCYGCKQQFRKTELIDYASPAAKIPHSYCPKCLAEKQERERFADKVCSIFGIKSPGPRIWTERKRLHETFGYTDDTIIDCLDYIYNVERHKNCIESLFLVQPYMIDRMMEYKRQVNEKVVSPQNTITYKVVDIKENDEPKKSEPINLNDFLDN